MKNSPSTDCFSSYEYKYKSNHRTNSNQKLVIKRDSKKSFIGCKSTNNGFATFLIDRIAEKKLYNLNEISTYVPKRSKSNLNLKITVAVNKNQKLLSYSREKMNRLKKNKLSNFDCSNTLSHKNDDEILSDEEQLMLKNLHSDLENKIFDLERDLRIKNENLQYIKNYIAYSKNENNKIMLIQKRYEIQINYTRKEIVKIKDELIKVF